MDESENALSELVPFLIFAFQHHLKQKTYKTFMYWIMYTMGLTLQVRGDGTAIQQGSTKQT